jgi:anaerobic selenocysteine-containing dehydrogenase
VEYEHPAATARLYTDGVFPTNTDYCETYGHDLLTGGAVTETEHRAMNPAGRAFLKGADWTPAHEEPSPDYPLRYTTGRTAYQFHTRTKTGRSRPLHQAAPDAWVEINPADAEPRGICEGDWVRVESPRGAIEVRARIGHVMPGAVFAPFHYGHWDPDDLAPDARDAPDAGSRLANELTMTVWDPVSKQPYFKTAACTITKVRDGDGPAPAPTTTASAPQTDLAADQAGDAEVQAPSPPPGPVTTSHVLEQTPTYPLDPTQRSS